MRKFCSSDQEKLLKFETDGREFANFLKWRGSFSYLRKKIRHKSTWKKILGFRNMQEKLEKVRWLLIDRMKKSFLGVLKTQMMQFSLNTAATKGQKCRTISQKVNICFKLCTYVLCNIWFMKYCSNICIHGLRTPNEGINQRYLKNWADVADKICFGRT